MLGFALVILRLFTPADITIIEKHFLKNSSMTMCLTLQVRSNEFTRKFVAVLASRHTNGGPRVFRMPYERE